MHSRPLFSPERLKQQALARVAQHPIVAYPTLVGLLAGVYSVAFDLSALSLGAMLGGLALGAGGWAFQYFVKGESHSLAILKRQREALQQRRQLAVAHLAQELAGTDSPQATRQLASLQAKFRNFEAILAKKLERQELAFNRHLSVAEQVYLNALDNLDNLATSLQSVSAIDAEELGRRIADLPADSGELDALQTRRQLWQQQQGKAEQLLLENEFAMTQLDLVSTRLADLTTKSGQAQMDMDDAMAELKQLIERSSRYHSSNHP